MVMMPYLSALALAVATLIFYLYNILWLKPEKIRRALKVQGITGPKPAFIVGNIPDMKRSENEKGHESKEESSEISHDYSSTIFPYFNRWREIYGPVFMFSFGSSISLYVSDPDLVKEISTNKSLDIGKTTASNKSFTALFGKGIIAASGHEWAIQRKIIAPEFFMEKVKGMVDLMAESSLPLMRSWEGKIERGGGISDIKIDEDFQSYAADVLSKACFGSNYAEGEEIFSKITSLQVAIPMKSMLYRLPGSTYLPTKNNRVVWGLGSEISSLIQKIVRERKKGANGEKDLLQSILKNSIGEGVDKTFIVDNCKNIYFAGQETTATAAKWALVLLASNPQWQTLVREEIMDVCGDHKPDMEKLKKMNLLTQVIQETLRLYPASAIIARQIYADMKFGDLLIPKETSLWIPILNFHHDPNLWGPDVNEFKPERFAKGVSSACKHPHLYMPFGFGPRTCLGQNFAMVELKIVLALILMRFKVSPSRKHRHSVELRLLLGPKNGVRLVIEKV
ncbi:uncharacterized protein A4U43_C08F33210 [Asparagus officinalis]|uniref:cytochrome P450 714C2-like n=1 Tax=Asparagus officinalis TaxID=4686 RepID=UPI00098E54DF|nr:cytochrome P450 714C2-like [Asparagus officinalis]ONK61752.1 uncharacterized protein A4U43_C08F33210 [Asparagus officinalis]